MSENKYIKVIEEAIDKGHVKYGDIFQYMAQNAISAPTPTDEFKDMFSAMDLYFVTDASKLDKSQLEHRQKVVDTFRKDKDEFGGEYDKVKHFLKGAYLGSNYGDTVGTAAGWFGEKGDTFKHAEGVLVNNLKPHQIGFDWKDYAYTKAGSKLGDYLTDLDTNQALTQMENFASGSLSLGNLYNPMDIKEGGVGEFDPLFSPFSDTTTDKVDKTVDTMIKNVSNAEPSIILDQINVQDIQSNETQLEQNQTIQMQEPLHPPSVQAYLDQFKPSNENTNSNTQTGTSEQSQTTQADGIDPNTGYYTNLPDSVNQYYESLGILPHQQQGNENDMGRDID